MERETNHNIRSSGDATSITQDYTGVVMALNLKSRQALNKISVDNLLYSIDLIGTARTRKDQNALLSLRQSQMG
ncbi:unnamed protein product [Schistosoma mattheei]|uniref:Uncharacterized protein n=1 Tax=Schistosoma mattheei TaxID=31246 RepID=A0A183NE19_9TREM|nr:unnamed protein product [Schistosoma mattheei]